MTKRLSISQPVVIDTELTPLDDTFWLEPNGATEQWYYVNNNSFSPNRTITPLLIVPKINAVDHSTNTSYSPQFSSDFTWTVMKYINGNWIGFPVTGTSQDFELWDIALLVKSNNYDCEHGIKITFTGKYIDPRDTNRTYTVSDTVVLTTSRDATVMYPNIKIDAPSTNTFDPLSASTSNFTFHASVDWSRVSDMSDVTDNGVFVWYGINSSQQEVLLNTLPYYVSGQHTDTVVVDAMYGKNLPIILRIKKTSSASDTNDVLPPKAQVNVVWQTPPISGIVTCDNGRTVRTTDNKNFLFKTIVSTNRGVIGDNIVSQNLRFNWKIRRATASNISSSTIQDTVTDLGWGQDCLVHSNDLLSTTTVNNASKLIMNDIYMLGAYERVKVNGENVTYNNHKVYGREIE